MIRLDNVIGLKLKLVTVENEVYYGQLHSYIPHTLLTLLVFPSKEELLKSSADDKSRSKKANILAINIQYISSVEPIEKEKLRKANTSNSDYNDLSMNETFASKINAPAFIPIDSLGRKIRDPNNRVILEQQKKFKVAKLSNGLHYEGKVLLKHLTKIIDVDTIEIDSTKGFMLKEHSIKILKPYKTSDVKYVDTNYGVNNTENNKDHTNKISKDLEAIKKIVDESWKEIDEFQKGG